MSRRELGRVEVMARVRSKQLRVVDAAVMLRLSYRQTKRLWKRYGEEGAAGLKHRSVGRRSNRAYAEELREKVLRLVRKKYSGAVGERFGPTLAAEHLRSEDGLRVDGETLRRWMLAEGLWSRERRRRRHLVKRRLVCKRSTIERGDESSSDTPSSARRRPSSDRLRSRLRSLPWLGFVV